jgi:hypothetical protein
LIIFQEDQIKEIPAKIFKWPDYLDGAWYQVTLLDDHPYLGGTACVYFNDIYPSGTLIVSNKILNDTPDIYATWDKDQMSNKLFVSPKIRKAGIGSSALYAGDFFLALIGIKIKYMIGKFRTGDYIFNKAYDLGLVIEPEEISDLNMFYFRDTAYPVIHFDKRMISYAK